MLALLAGGGTWLVIKKPWSSGAAKINFATTTASKGNIAAQVTANGTLSARGTVLVGAQVSGRVVEIHADFNDKVSKGQLIAKLDESVLTSQVAQATASMAVATANVTRAQVGLADAERQRARQRELQAQQLVAGATVEAAEVAYDTAKASLGAARAQAQLAVANVSQAKLNLSYATIRSPVDGVVLSRAVDVGQTVAASLQAPTLFTIAQDLAVMQIDTAVAEADVGRLTEGMKASFSVDAFSGKTFEGVVRQVRNAPTSTQGVVTYDAVIDVDNKAKLLRPGMTANVTFTLEKVSDVIKVPNAALRFKPTMDQMASLRERYNLQRPGGGSGGSGGSGGPNGGSGKPRTATPG
ncbi:MAG: efflux RND transporter periplasmic adaptor subunit, partial [Kofleriaceae bacterium]|nr:efflux RND transporter periplasmic adaptor subunit [Kofleriaceae bacterium]